MKTKTKLIVLPYLHCDNRFGDTYEKRGIMTVDKTTAAV